MKVMLVDDDPIALDLVAHFLGIATHHNVNAAPSAVAALEAISDAKDPYDCFLCDIKMPDMDGIALVREIRQSPGHEHTPIVMMTASQEMQELGQAFSAGATDYVSKPVDLHDLPRRLQAAQRLALDKAWQSQQAGRSGEARRDVYDAGKNWFQDPVPVRGVEGLIDYVEFENYLRQLVRKPRARLSTVAVRIADEDRHSAMRSLSGFEAALTLVGDAIRGALLTDGGVMSYRGDGTFLCILERRMKLWPSADRETTLNALCQDIAEERSQTPVLLLVGQEVPLGQGAYADALDALATAVLSAEARSVAHGDVYGQDMHARQQRPRSLMRRHPEEARLEKSAYSDLLTSLMDDRNDDRWPNRLNSRGPTG
ncbi:response regulator [Maritalea mobilis]|uniref:response regulator n=1 Tax=Maritalea mobilis TaxID=483324 RepID=UPI001C94DBE2|nr:response regulator [Maritalea mobilis]MBY6201414.1 response regulator [Maritalea mobilis]